MTSDSTLERLSQEEDKLIQAYRAADDRARQDIVKNATQVSLDYPRQANIFLIANNLVGKNVGLS